MLPLNHPKSVFHVSGNHQTVSHLVAPRNVCLPGSHGVLASQFCHMVPQLSHGTLAACFSGAASHFGCNCWDSWPFCAISHTERSLGPKGQCQPVILSTPFYGRQARSGFWYIPGASLKLTPVCTLRSWKILTLKKAWPNTNWGSPQNNGL